MDQREPRFVWPDTAVIGPTETASWSVTLTAPRFATAIPGAELISLPGCGHVPMADDPDLVAAAITGVTAARTG